MPRRQETAQQEAVAAVVVATSSSSPTHPPRTAELSNAWAVLLVQAQERVGHQVPQAHQDIRSYVVTESQYDTEDSNNRSVVG